MALLPPRNFNPSFEQDIRSNGLAGLPFSWSPSEPSLNLDDPRLTDPQRQAILATALRDTPLASTLPATPAMSNADVVRFLGSRSAMPMDIGPVGGGEGPAGGGTPGPGPGPSVAFATPGNLGGNVTGDIGPQGFNAGPNIGMNTIAHAIDLALSLAGMASPNPLSIVSAGRNAFNAGKNLIGSIQQNNAQSIPDSSFHTNTNVTTPPNAMAPEHAFVEGTPSPSVGSSLPDSSFNINTDVSVPGNAMSPESAFDMDPTGTAPGSPSASAPSAAPDAGPAGPPGADAGDSGDGGSGDGGGAGDGGGGDGGFKRGGVVKARPSARAQRVSNFEKKFANARV